MTEMPTVPDRVMEDGTIIWRAVAETVNADLDKALQEQLVGRGYQLDGLHATINDLELRNRGLQADLDGAMRNITRMGELLESAQLDARNGEGRANENSARITELNRQLDEAKRSAAAELAEVRESYRNERDRYDTAVAEKDIAEEALAGFKHQVRLVATDEAEKNNWCPEVDKVLSRLGLTRISFVYTARVEVGIDIRVTRPLSKEISETPDEDAVAEMLIGVDPIEAVIRRHLNIDEEHTDFDIDDISWSVQEVTEVGNE